MNLTIEFFIFELVYLSTIFALKLTIAIFLDQICPKRYFRSKTENMNVIITFRLFKLVLVPNFSLNWWLLFFWLDLPKKSFSGLKQKKWTPCFFYIILHIQIGLGRNFNSNWHFWFLWNKFTQKGISCRKLKKWTSSLNSTYSK